MEKATKELVKIEGDRYVPCGELAGVKEDVLTHRLLKMVYEQQKREKEEYLNISKASVGLRNKLVKDDRLSVSTKIAQYYGALSLMEICGEISNNELLTEVANFTLELVNK